LFLFLEDHQSIPRSHAGVQQDACSSTSGCRLRKRVVSPPTVVAADRAKHKDSEKSIQIAMLSFLEANRAAEGTLSAKPE